MSRKALQIKPRSAGRRRQPPRWVGICRELLPGLIGLWLALALLKWGNPVILDSRIEIPKTFIAVLHQPWPISWGYAMLAMIFVVGLPVWQWPVAVPRTLVTLPLIWFLWQTVSATQTLDPSLTAVTVPHFFACIVAFYLGLFALSRLERADLLWFGVVGGWLIVVLVGWRQEFGGLREVREFFYSLPNWQSQPPELIAKVNSDRIYSTLVYPNALAGVILLFTPSVVSVIHRALQGRPMWVRWGAVAILLVAAGCCMIWSGSKGGWLIALAIICIAILKAVNSVRIRAAFILVVLSLGLFGFWMKHATYFQKGATSVAARQDYWKAAVVAFKERPLLGSGPGSFMTVYRRLKSPEAEMTRLVHNDYLQQASDSGILGFLAYALFSLGSLWFLYRNSRAASWEFWTWLGLAAGAAQSAIEFSLYIPALAWAYFLGIGVLLGRAGLAKSVDNPFPGHYGSPPRL